MPKKLVSRRITVRLDGAMVEQFESLKLEALGEEGDNVGEAAIARMLIRRALNDDMQRAAVAESLILMYRINQLMIQRMRAMLEGESDEIIAEILSGD